MSDESEEKTLPPSEQKLRKAREKGQVANSADFVTALMVMTGVVIIYYSAQSFIELYNVLFLRALSIMNNPSHADLAAQLVILIKGMMSSLAPLGLVLIVVAFIANILFKKGIPFSMHPIIPDFKKISPGKGLKNMFAMKNMIEFGIALFRVTVWVVASVFIIYLWYSDLINAPICGAGCLISVTTSLAQSLFITASILLIASGLADMPVQTSLFKKDQKMSRSEQKRENKESQGSPEIKNARRQINQEAIAEDEQNVDTTPGLLISGDDCVVEIRYIAGKTPVPVVIAKAEGAEARAILEKARADARAVEFLGDIANEIFVKSAKNRPILQTHFNDVAAALVKHQMIG